MTKMIIILSIFCLCYSCKKESSDAINDDLTFERVNESYIVTANSLILREKPDKNSKAIGKIPFQTKIDITNKSNDIALDSRYAPWGKTIFKDKEGYVFLGFARPNIPLKILRIIRSIDEQYEATELIASESDEEDCGSWFSKFCTTQIKSLNTQKIIFERPHYGFKEFIDENNVILSYGGGENCQTSFEYKQINLINLKESNFFEYESDTCSNESPDDHIIHKVCIKNDCYTVIEMKNKIEILNQKKVVIRSFNKLNTLEINYREWKNPELSIDGKIFKFSEIISD